MAYWSYIYKFYDKTITWTFLKRKNWLKFKLELKQGSIYYHHLTNKVYWVFTMCNSMQFDCFILLWPSLVVQTIKNLPGIQETRVQSLDREDSPGEGNGYPLQYSCLENHMERGAWWATVHGVTLSTHTLLLLIIFSLSLMSPVPKALSDPP